MAVEELNQHIGLTPANIVMADYRNPNEIAITYIDPFAGLSKTLWTERGDIKFPDHFKFNNPLHVDFNFPLIAGLVQTGGDTEHTEVHIKGAAGRLDGHFEIQGVSLMAIAQMYKDDTGVIPNLRYRSWDGQQLLFATMHGATSADLEASVKRLRAQAKRPGSEGADKKPSKGPSSDGPPIV